jgi:pimeloyl-ACP methyl ester carboxylesterase
MINATSPGDQRHESRMSMNFIEIGDGDKPTVVFAHGWARSHHDFIPAAEALGTVAKSILIDLPGFGVTPRPDAGWDTKDYADHVASFLKDKDLGPIVWVGHSFGGRVGLRLAVHHPDLLAGLIIVAGAGIPRPRSAWSRFRGKLRQRQFKLLRALAGKDERRRANLEKTYGSPDYIQSKELGLRDIFIKTVTEDQSADLPKIKARTELLYGALDTETPAVIGQRMADLIPDARLTVFPAFDHISIVHRGHHIIALRAKMLLEKADLS